jgi:hypothetical protein
MTRRELLSLALGAPLMKLLPTPKLLPAPIRITEWSCIAYAGKPLIYDRYVCRETLYFFDPKYLKYTYRG